MVVERASQGHPRELSGLVKSVFTSGLPLPGLWLSFYFSCRHLAQRLGMPRLAGGSAGWPRTVHIRWRDNGSEEARCVCETKASLIQDWLLSLWMTCLYRWSWNYSWNVFMSRTPHRTRQWISDILIAISTHFFRPGLQTNSSHHEPIRLCFLLHLFPIPTVSAGEHGPVCLLTWHAKQANAQLDGWSRDSCRNPGRDWS